MSIATNFPEHSETKVGRHEHICLKYLCNAEWQSAGIRYQNFYDIWLFEEMVVENVKGVNAFVGRLN